MCLSYTYSCHGNSLLVLISTIEHTDDFCPTHKFSSTGIETSIVTMNNQMSMGWCGVWAS